MIASFRISRPLTAALAMSFTLAGCAGLNLPNNRSLESVHQPVVERQEYSLDLTTGAGGLSASEKGRLRGWFEALNLRNGDRISIDDPLSGYAARADVEEVAGKYGILVSKDSPVTPGYVNAGTLRVILSRSVATVPHCPDWSDKLDTNPLNANSRNYGCAVNSNFAAMIANPEDLIKGVKGNGDDTVLTASKAVNAFRAAQPSGGGGTTIKGGSSKGS